MIDSGACKHAPYGSLAEGDADYGAHVRYCHANPVKHGFVERGEDWPYSSVHRDIRAGRYDFAAERYGFG